MLRRPRPLPRRFNRPVTPFTRSVVQRRHAPRKQRTGHQFRRLASRLQRRSEMIRKTIARFLMLVVVGGVLMIIGLALFSPVFHVQNISVVRTDQRIDQERIQQSLASLFNEHMLFISNQQVRDLLAASVADLQSAEITKEYPSTISIRPYLSPIIARLTIEEPQPVQTGTGAAAGSGAAATVTMSHFLTDDGMYVAYPAAQVQVGTGVLNLRVVDWGVRPEPGRQLVEPALLTIMQQAERQLSQEFEHTIRERRVFVRAREFHLQTETFALWFDLRSPLEDQLQRYRLFLQSAGPGGATQYIDLRLKDKIVYR